MKLLSRVSRRLKDLAATHQEHVNAYNFVNVLTILNGLRSTQSDAMTWVNYLSDEGEKGSNGLETGANVCKYTFQRVGYIVSR